MENIEGKTALGFDPWLGATICYVGNLICSLGLVYSIVVLVTEKTDKFVRFHALQSILFSALGLIFGLGLGIGGGVAAIVDSLLGFPLLSLVVGLVGIIVGIVVFVTFLKAVFNARRGEIYKAPLIGKLAEKWA